MTTAEHPPRVADDARAPDGSKATHRDLIVRHAYARTARVPNFERFVATHMLHVHGTYRTPSHARISADGRGLEIIATRTLLGLEPHHQSQCKSTDEPSGCRPVVQNLVEPRL